MSSDRTALVDSRFSRKFCIAPMMDYTDRHDRYFLRLISQHVFLYSEMINAHAVVRGDRDYLLGFDAAETPLALQLGGSDPKLLAQAVRLAEPYGYVEINLNVGCPSDRVQAGKFGACLMQEPNLVAECVAAMAANTALPVTVKNRIGVDHQDSYDFLCRFVQTVSAAGCKTFIIHARKAWLQGLSPKQNREVPPLDYSRVYQLKQDFPELEIIINGGIAELTEVDQHIQHVDGVMLGRAAYHHPFLLAEVDQRYYGSVQPAPTRKQVVQALLPYVEQQLQRGVSLQSITRHITGLYTGLPGARAWRRHLSENAHRKGAGVNVIEQALALVEP